MGCGTALVKYSVFIFNLLFVLAGIALIAVGVAFYLGVDQVKDSLGPAGDYVQIVPIITIVLGCIVFVIAFLGCCGAIRESICMLSTYGVIMLVLFLIQVGVGTYALITYNNTAGSLKEDISNEFKKQMQNWGDNDRVDIGIGAIQQNFQCCGAIRPEDWVGKIPKSCCSNTDSNSCSTPPTADQIFKNGCASKIFDAVENIVKVIAIVVFTVAAFELAAAIVAFCLSSCIRNNVRRGYY